MAEHGSKSSTRAPTDVEDTGGGRRRFLQQAAIGTAVAWTAPLVMSITATAQASGAPTTTTTTPPLTDVFIAVGGDGSGRTFTTSDDGATWPITTTPIGTGEVHAVAYGPLGTKWVSVGRNGANAAILSSVDNGTTWSPTGPSPAGRLLDVATNGSGRWVAVGEANPSTFPGNPLVLYSADNGISWQAGAFSSTINDLHGLATDGTNWIAAGQNDSGQAIITISTDGGATWATPLILNAAGGHVYDVASNGSGGWLAVGSTASGGDKAVIWFASGGNIALAGNWTQAGPFGSGRFTGVVSDKGANMIAVGTHDPGGFSFTFNSGATAGAFPVAAPTNLHGVTTDRTGTWIAFGADGSGMRTYTSTDNGATWPVSAQPAGGLLLGGAARVVA